MPKGIYIYSLIATLALGFCLALFFTGRTSFQATSTPVQPIEISPSKIPTPTEVITKNPLFSSSGWVIIKSKTIGADSCDTDSPKVKALNAYLEADNPAYQKQIGDFNYSIKWHDNAPPEIYSGIKVFYIANTFNLTTSELISTPPCGIPTKTILGATEDKIYFSQSCGGGIRPDSNTEFNKYQSYVKDCQDLQMTLSSSLSR